MTVLQLSKYLPTPDATAKFAEQIGAILQQGDVLLLEGDIGAGKTHFARALIQSLQDTPEDVPSPTFTLVQTYETKRGTVLHADLYRLTNPDDVAELGLLDAFESSICLVEWPDRLGEDMPADRVTLTFTLAGTVASARSVQISATNAHWQQRLQEALND